MPSKVSLKITAALIIFIILVAVAAYYLFFSPQETGFTDSSGVGALKELVGMESVTTEVNAKAPGFAALSFSGDDIRSIDYIGEKVILLEFWSVFCRSCIQEMPHLARLYEKYRDEGLEVIGVNTDFFVEARIKQFLRKLEPPPIYPIIHDQDQKISEAFHVEALPVTVLIDTSGWVRMYHLGYRPGDERELEKIARKWLGRRKEKIETVGPVEGRTAVAASMGTISEGQTIPDFMAETIEGRRISFQDYCGDRSSVLFFWSIFCQPCRSEMPFIAAESRKINEGSDVAFLSVNLDAPRLAGKVATFLEKEPLPFPTLLDARAVPSGFISRELGIGYTPTLIITGPEGVVRKVLVGSFSNEELEAAFKDYIYNNKEG